MRIIYHKIPLSAKIVLCTIFADNNEVFLVCTNEQDRRGQKHYNLLINHIMIAMFKTYREQSIYF